MRGPWNQQLHNNLRHNNNNRKRHEWQDQIRELLSNNKPPFKSLLFYCCLKRKRSRVLASRDDHSVVSTSIIVILSSTSWSSSSPFIFYNILSEKGHCSLLFSLFHHSLVCLSSILNLLWLSLSNNSLLDQQKLETSHWFCNNNKTAQQRNAF